jgi:hypothetical protein
MQLSQTGSGVLPLQAKGRAASQMWQAVQQLLSGLCAKHRIAGHSRHLHVGVMHLGGSCYSLVPLCPAFCTALHCATCCCSGCTPTLLTCRHWRATSERG